MKKNAIFISEVKKYRIIKGYSQEELANLVDVRRETIVRLEQSKYTPTLKLAIELEKVLEIPINELFRFEDI
ncbi:MAG: helix-turn-helix domain-containing protein [Lachnospiraceae bacterium]|nr:helix-turn-helix domain-containing protein [Lachnospiraceae bacterium]